MKSTVSLNCQKMLILRRTSNNKNFAQSLTSMQALLEVLVSRCCIHQIQAIREICLPSFGEITKQKKEHRLRSCSTSNTLVKQIDVSSQINVTKKRCTKYSVQPFFTTRLNSAANPAASTLGRKCMFYYAANGNNQTLQRSPKCLQQQF